MSNGEIHPDIQRALDEANQAMSALPKSVQVRHYGDVLHLAKRLNNSELAAQTLIKLGDLTRNPKHYREAVKLTKAIGNRDLQEQAEIGLSNLRQQQGRITDIPTLIEKGKQWTRDHLLPGAKQGAIGTAHMPEEINSEDLQRFDARIGQIGSIPGSKERADAIIALGKELAGQQLWEEHLAWEAQRKNNPEHFTPLAKVESPALKRFMALRNLAGNLPMNTFDDARVSRGLNEVLDQSRSAFNGQGQGSLARRALKALADAPRKIGETKERVKRALGRH